MCIIGKEEEEEASTAVVEILGPKCIGVTSLTFRVT